MKAAMKTKASLIVHAKFSGEDVIQALSDVYPKGQDGDRFECLLPWGDARLMRLLGVLAAHGLKPSGPGPASPSDYHLAINRTYSRADLHEAAYLTFQSKTLLYDVRRDEDGTIRLRSDRLKSGLDLGSAKTTWLVVSDRVKGLMEHQGLVHAVFRQTRIDGPAGGATRRSEGAFWELTSDLILPPMGPPARFIHGRTGAEVPGDSDEPFIFREGVDIPGYYFLPTEPHYDEDALRSAGPFDLALTFEKIAGGYLGGLPICSQRFRRFCIDNSLEHKLYWTPVRVDRRSQA
ncbi:hypothetical protein [Paludisphaera soli]|uniref:hypothetical protein n=1 Tax=Paludisphaera soli TaxID=2712865 RepID=UPI0013E9A862|nr:hypothetical protein [Paludisphaera soli]